MTLVTARGCDPDSHRGMRRDADRNTRRRSERQHGAFSRLQCLIDGHNKRTIQHRLGSGIWKRVFPGVYALQGCPDGWRLRQMAACLWSKDGLAAGKAAGFLYDLPDCDPAPIEIMTGSRCITPFSEVIVHRTNWLPWEQISRIDRIPVTSVERTLLSLAAQLSPRRAAIVVDQAISKGLTTLAAIDRHLWLTARQGRDGCSLLREIKNERWSIGAVPTTPLETVVFEMIVGAGLPLPKLQAEIFDDRGHFVARPDFLYTDEKVVVEAHSRQWHESLEAAKRDQERFNRLSVLGYRVVFVTWADATRNQFPTTSLISRMLEEPDFALPWRPAEWT